MPFALIIAEVLDKKPSLISIWLSHVFVAGLGYVLCRRNWRWLFAFLPLSMLGVWFGAADLWDQWVGPATLRESRSFFVQWHIAMAQIIAAPIVGFWHRFRSCPRRRTDAAGSLVRNVVFQ
jgi:hypothetical protein